MKAIQKEASTTQNSQWSNWNNDSHNIVQVSNQEENLCCWPSGIPNSCLCQLRVLGDIPSILAISTQRNPNASLSSWICSCLISYLGLSAFTYPAGLFRGWRVTDGGWRVTGSGWRVAGGGWWVRPYLTWLFCIALTNESHCLVLQVIVIWSPLPALTVPNPE